MPRGPSAWVRDHRLASFFLLAYALSWSLDLAVLALGMEPSWTRWILTGFFSALGPTAAAAVVLAVSGDSLRDWLAGLLRWRVHPAWYLAALGVPVLVSLGAGAITQGVGGPVDFAAFAPDPVSLGIGVVLATTIGGGQEELGWRGFAQPELQAHYGGLRAAVVLGVLWGGWHLPLFVDPTAPHSQWPLAAQLSYFVGIVAFAILLAWVYNGSGGSVLLVMLMHGTENAAGGLVPVDVARATVAGTTDWAALAPLNVGHAVVMWAVAVVAVVGTGLLAERTSADGRPAGEPP